MILDILRSQVLRIKNTVAYTSECHGKRFTYAIVKKIPRQALS